MPRLTHEQLRTHLRLCADVLRSAAEPSNYLNCMVILGLLVLKRMSDHFQDALSRQAFPLPPLVTSTWMDGENYHIPVEARWARLKSIQKDIIPALDEAFSALSYANPSLSASLDGIKFASASHALGSPQQIDRLLGKIIVHLSNLNLSDTSVPGPDALGHACDELIENFADAAGRKAHGELAPSSIARLLVELVGIEQGHRVCDPACGIGLNLVISAQHVSEKFGKDVGIHTTRLTLHGQELNPVAWAICKLNLLLHNISSSRIEIGDVIVEPKLAKNGELILYDRILCIPPFGHRIPANFPLTADIHNRFHNNKSIRAESAFIQHTVASLAPDGCAAIVVPHGALFRGSSDVAVREDLLKGDIFEAVIGLPPNLFWGTSISAAVLVLNKNKRPERSKRVLFIDASNDYKQHPGRNILRPEDVARITEAFRNWRDDAPCCRVVSTCEIEKNDFDMSISRYLVGPERQESVDDIAELLILLAEAEHVRDIAAARMDVMLNNLGFRRDLSKH